MRKRYTYINSTNMAKIKTPLKLFRVKKLVFIKRSLIK